MKNCRVIFDFWNFLWDAFVPLVITIGIIMAVIFIALHARHEHKKFKHSLLENRVVSDAQVGIIEVEVRNERHEFIIHANRGICHLPNCKFCSHDGVCK